MSLKTKVHISTNNLTDARYCAGMGVEFIEFIVDPNHKDALAKETYLGISQWIEGVEFVGYFSSTKNLLQTCQDLNITTIASHNIEVLRSVDQTYKKILKVTIDSLNQSDLTKLNSIQDSFDYLYLESNTINQLSSFNFLTAINHQVILGFGFDEQSVHQAIEEGKITALGLKGGHEERPGFKDMDELADILEAIEID